MVLLLDRELEPVPQRLEGVTDIAHRILEHGRRPRRETQDRGAGFQSPEPVGDAALGRPPLVPAGELWTFEPDPEFAPADLRSGLRRVLRWPPVFLLRRAFRKHGFSEDEYRTLVAPVVQRSPFEHIVDLRPFLWLRWMRLVRAG